MSAAPATTVNAYLHHAVERDGRKGLTGNLRGLRDTREIADAANISTASARRQLQRMQENGAVMCFDPEGTGSAALLWKIKKGGS